MNDHSANRRTVTEAAYGKINLYLDVLGKRPDGYHEIKSVMHTVSLCDTVTVTLGGEGRRMTCSDPTLTCGEDNLCLRAANAFFDAIGSDEGCSLHLEKRLPREAGLGGGSADAAAVFRALNTLCGEPLSREELIQVSAKVGADVPFCLVGGSCLAEGIGERLSPFPTLPPCHLVISGGIGHVSTPEAYRQIDTTPPQKKGDFVAFEAAMRGGDLKEICKHLYNRFEDTLPSSQKVKAILREEGACGALMTGSGAAVFGLFEGEETAKTAAEALKKQGLSAFVATPIC